MIYIYSGEKRNPVGQNPAEHGPHSIALRCCSHGIASHSFAAFPDPLRLWHAPGSPQALEDAVLHEAARQADADALVTRNESDFKKAVLAVYGPSELINIVAAQQQENPDAEDSMFR